MCLMRCPISIIVFDELELIIFASQGLTLSTTSFNNEHKRLHFFHLFLLSNQYDENERKLRLSIVKVYLFLFFVQSVYVYSLLCLLIL